MKWPTCSASLALALAGCSAPGRKEPKLPRLEYVRTELRQNPDGGTHQCAVDVLRLVNETPYSIEFIGRDEFDELPSYRYRYWREDTWNTFVPDPYVCGWPKQVEISPGEGIEFDVHGDFGRKRVGIHLVNKESGEEILVWSPGYDPIVADSELLGLLDRLSRQLPATPYSQNQRDFEPVFQVPGVSIPMVCDGYTLTLWREVNLDRLWILEQGGIGGRARWLGPVEDDEDRLIRSILSNLRN